MEKQFNKHNLSFPVTFQKIDEVNSEDTRFTRVKCWLMHTGKNYNQSNFSREVIEEAIPTLSYIPIVGFLEENDIGEEDFSDHRYIITKDDGKIRRKYMGSAYGVILSPEDNNAHFEKRVCDDGVEREFIVADGLMWNFLENSAKVMNRDLIKDHSIELDENSIDGYEDESGVFHFSKFSFRAACVLGGGCQPAMEGSTVEVQFTVSDFVRNIQSELNDKYKTFTELKMVNEKTKQGGIESMQNTDYSLTLLNQFEEIATTVRQHETFADKYGYELPRYYAVDIQDNEVIVVDAMNNYNYFGLSFAIGDGCDKAEIDFESAKKKKLCYEDYVEGSVAPTGAFDFGAHIAEIKEADFTKLEEANTKVSEFEAKVSEFETAKNEIEEKYNQVNAEFEEMKPKYDDYVRAEQARIEAELDAQKDAEFAKYESVLTDNVEFEALKEKKSELTVKEIESECAILYARKNLAQANFSKSNDGVITAGLIKDNSNDGMVETKYGFIPVKR